jgi:2-C-methyl-D-erythritol 4-phosphate cytidylyltransferase
VLQSLKEYALIVAGGKGTRIQSKIPKQFLDLTGTPVLLHTIEAFFKYSDKISIILVLPETEMSLWDSIVKRHGFKKTILVTKGGDSRFQSVRNGLNAIQDNGLVAIHDGVRPLVSTETIAMSFKMAAEFRSAVASVPLKESIRTVEHNGTRAQDRSKYLLIQTPQTFEISLIKQAYQLPEDVTLTDDASVAERAGHTIKLFEGSYENLKITTPEDLIIAEALLRSRRQL